MLLVTGAVLPVLLACAAMARASSTLRMGLLSSSGAEPPKIGNMRGACAGEWPEVSSVAVSADAPDSLRGSTRCPPGHTSQPASIGLTAAPKLKGRVELFDKIDEPWLRDSGNRWVAFSIDGKFCYPSDGSVVDAETGKKTSMKISASEKLVEVEFRNDVAVKASGQQGGVYS